MVSPITGVATVVNLSDQGWGSDNYDSVGPIDEFDQLRRKINEVKDMAGD